MGGSCPTVTLPSKATEEQWSVVCRGAKRVKVLRAPSVETKNPFIVLKGVTEEEAGAVTLPQGSVCVW